MTDFGTVRRDGGSAAVRFERVYAAAPEELWTAWTEPDRIARWLGATLTGPLSIGAAVRLVWGEDPASQVDLLVEELAPPERLVWRWTIFGEPPTVLRVELSPVEGGTRLVLDHSRLPSGQVAGLSAGWHEFLDGLGSGVAAGADRWRELLPAYQEKVSAL